MKSVEIFVVLSRILGVIMGIYWLVGMAVVVSFAVEMTGVIHYFSIIPNLIMIIFMLIPQRKITSPLKSKLFLLTFFVYGTFWILLDLVFRSRADWLGLILPITFNIFAAYQHYLKVTNK